eukprot:1155072-Pelagomonas_calceolata.AAC.1
MCQPRSYNLDTTGFPDPRSLPACFMPRPGLLVLKWSFCSEELCKTGAAEAAIGPVDRCAD